jgi:hypothetical protein
MQRRRRRRRRAQLTMRCGMGVRVSRTLSFASLSAPRSHSSTAMEASMPPPRSSSAHSHDVVATDA